jgi:predicted PurR-regulated permease PerM
MNSAEVSASIATTESARTADEAVCAVDASLVTLPATRTPVDARGLALGVLAALASVFALSWAQGFLVPLLLGIVIAYTLNPLVAWLEAIRVPRVVGTVLVMASMAGGLALGTYSLRGQMQTIIEQLPEAATKFADGLARMRIGQTGNLQIMQDAATAVEKAATQARVARQRRVSLPLTLA